MPRTAERKVAAQARVQVAEKQPSDQPPAETAPIVPAATATQTPTPNKETPEVILKCLIMLFELMQSSDITSLNATLQTILDEFVKTSVSSVNVEIKMTALKTMGKIYQLEMDGTPDFDRFHLEAVHKLCFLGRRGGEEGSSPNLAETILF